MRTTREALRKTRRGTFKVFEGSSMSSVAAAAAVFGSDGGDGVGFVRYGE